MTDIRSLRTPREKSLFTACFIISTLIWIVVVVSIIGLLYGLLGALFVLAAHALLLAHFKGSAVRVSPEQLPDIYQRVAEACRRLGMARMPVVFVTQAGGALNAFATRFLKRDFVVIFSDLLEACGEEGKEADMVIGHEVGHLALGHLRWLWFLAPARLVPWLGTAYSRACEYSCDLCGLEAAADLDAANRGLAVLAAGGKYGRRTNLAAFSLQSGDLGGFWASVHELNATHPPLAKRVAALINRRTPGTVRIPRRNFFAHPLAPFFAFASPQGLGGLVAVAAVIGILAAIAIPNFMAYKEKAQVAMMDQMLGRIYEAAKVHHDEEDGWPCDLEEIDLSDLRDQAGKQGWKIELNCERNYAAIFYPSQGKKKYRAIFFEDGEMKGGTEGE